MMGGKGGALRKGRTQVTVLTRRHTYRSGSGGPNCSEAPPSPFPYPHPPTTPHHTTHHTTSPTAPAASSQPKMPSSRRSMILAALCALCLAAAVVCEAKTEKDVKELRIGVKVRRGRRASSQRRGTSCSPAHNRCQPPPQQPRATQRLSAELGRGPQQHARPWLMSGRTACTCRRCCWPRCSGSPIASLTTTAMSCTAAPVQFKPKDCPRKAKPGDTIHVHYTGLSAVLALGSTVLNPLDTPRRPRLKAPHAAACHSCRHAHGRHQV
jgi:hypothetical protein